MMKLFEKRAGKKTRGQTMVEFALILPVLLMTMYGVMEFGRLLFIYITTASATREAARYAAAVGISENGLPYYNDCAGIRSAAQRVGVLAGIQDNDITIQYDRGPGTTPYSSCPASGSGPELGDRIVVIVDGHFEPILPLIPWSPVALENFANIRSETARTIIRNVRVSENFIAPQIVTTQPPSPYVTFSSSQTEVEFEDVGIISVTVQTDIPVPAASAPLTVEIGIIDVLEALGEGVDYQINSSLTMDFLEGDQFKDIDIAIINDSLYENTERIILYVRRVSNNNLGYPRLHIIRIAGNDADQTPIAYFYPWEDVSISESDAQLVIPVILDRPSGVAASVDFTITRLSNGPDFNYTPITGRLNFPVDYGSAARTVYSSSAVTIFPLDDFIATGDRELRITLTNPQNALLDIADPIAHPYTRRITIVNDDLCSLDYSDPVLSTIDFRVDIENTGIDATLAGLNVEFSPEFSTELRSASMQGVGVWSGNKTSPSGITSAEWIVGSDRMIAGGTTERIVLQFTGDPLTSLDSLSLDFGICGVMNIPTPIFP
jgi:hypothetical protein